MEEEKVLMLKIPSLAWVTTGLLIIENFELPGIL